MATTKFTQEQLDKVFEEAFAGFTTGNTEPKSQKPKDVIKDFEDDSEHQGTETNTTFKGEFGCLPPSGQDFGFWKHSTEDWDLEDQSYIPSIDDTHVWDYEWLEGALRAQVMNMKVLTHGPTGSGKSTSHEQLAAHLNQPFFRLNGRGDMESDTLLGKPWVNNGTMDYIMGDLPQKMQKGYFVLFDEPWKTPSSIQMALQRMYERGGVLQLDDMVLKEGEDFSKKQIKPHKAFRMFLADNVVGTGDQMEDYGATLLQDASTLNRIDFVLHLDYLEPEQEEKLIRRKVPQISEARARHMVQLANLVRKNKEQGKLGVTMSPRQLITWAEQAVIMKDYIRPLKMVMFNRLSGDDEKATFINEFKAVFDMEW